MQFGDITGKQSVKAALIKRIKSGQLPHAQLFSGPAGSGKLALALATVQYMMCKNPTDEDSCGQCPACAKNRKLIHPDVHFSFPVVPKKSGAKPISDEYIELWREAVTSQPNMSYFDWMTRIGAENKQGNITKEECRSIIQKLALKPFESEEKVLIMWLPEYLGKEGNSLLKLIEEPPAKTFFILITENPDNILPTILSRTQMTRIPAYSLDEIRSFVLQTNPDADADAIAFLAGGDINAAAKLLESTDNDLTEVFQNWMRLCFRKDVPGLMKWSDETGAKGRENIKNFLQYGMSIVREAMAHKMIPDYTIRLGKNEQQFVANFSGVLQFTNIEVLYEGLNDGISQIERNANPKLTLFQLSLKLRDTFMAAKKA